MMRLLAVVLACSSAVATTPTSKPALRPVPVLHRARQLSVGVARSAVELRNVVGQYVNPQEPASVSMTEAAIVCATAITVQVVTMRAVASAILPHVIEFIFKTLNGCAMSQHKFACVFGMINGFVSGLAGGVAFWTTFSVCILLLRTLIYARPRRFMHSKVQAFLGRPPTTSLGRLRGGDCTNEAWLHLWQRP